MNEAVLRELCDHGLTETAKWLAREWAEIEAQDKMLGEFRTVIDREQGLIAE